MTTNLDTLLAQALALVGEDKRGELADVIEQIVAQAQQKALEDACKLECKWCALGRPATPAIHGEWIHHSLTANLDEWEWCQAGRIRNLMARQEAANGQD